MKRYWSLFLCLVLFLWSCISSPPVRAQQLQSLQQNIESVIQSRKAQIGVAVILNGKDTLTVNNSHKYPLMSVFKFHQALAVAHALSGRHASLDSVLLIDHTDLRKDTYSPLREEHPEGITSISVRQLLNYTLLLSDNNACDILFKRVLGVHETDSYIRSLGVRDFSIVATEKDMHDNPEFCYANWSSPLATLQLLEKLLNGKILDEASRKFILNTMMQSKTGQDRIPRFLPRDKVKVGHKTGSSDMNAQGVLTAINDMGFVLLPDGRRFTVAVFIKDSHESFSDNEAIIAAISEKVYTYMQSASGAAK